MAILNSKLVNYVFQHRYVDINIKGVYLEEIPIRTVDFTNNDDLSQYHKLTNLVSQALTLKGKATATKASLQQTLIERQFDSIDDQINELVYDIYHINENERSIINASL